MAQLGRWTGGASANFPTTTWSALPSGAISTQERNDGGIYSWNSSTSTLTLPSSNLADGYLLISRIESVITHNNRCVQVERWQQVSGTGNFATMETSGYARNNNNPNMNSQSIAFVDNPSAGAEFQLQWVRDNGSGTPAGSMAGASVGVIPLYYSDVGIYTSTVTELLGGTTPNAADISTTVVEGTNITRSGNVVTVTGNNKRYLILGGHHSQGRGGRTQRLSAPIIDGTYRSSAQSYTYIRDSNNDLTGMSFHDLMETATADRTISLGVYRGLGVSPTTLGGADIDGNTPSLARNALIVIELNDSAEVFRSVDGTGGQSMNPTSVLDLNLCRSGDVEYADAASWVRASDTAMEAQVAMDALVAANVAGAYGSDSSTRAEGAATLTVNGTEIPELNHGAYARGNQGSTDTWGVAYNPIGARGLAANDDIGFSVQRTGDGGPIQTNPDWVGFWGINLDTLQPSGGGVTVNATGIGSTASVGTASVAGSAVVSPAGVDAASGVGAATVTTATNATVNATGVSILAAVGTATVDTSSAVTVSATGVQAASELGSVAATGDAVAAPSGVSAVASAGSAVVDLSKIVAATGVSASAQIGATTTEGDATVNVSGVAASSGVGSASVDLSKIVSVTGVAATGAQGAVSASGQADVALTGSSSTGAVGAVTAAFGVQVSPTGVDASPASGSVSVTADAIVQATGVAAVAAPGSAAVSLPENVSATGVSSTGTVGTVIVLKSVDVTVAGLAAAAATGAVDVGIGVTVPVLGVQAPSVVGDASTNLATVQVSGSQAVILAASRVAVWKNVSSGTGSPWSNIPNPGTSVWTEIVP